MAADTDLAYFAADLTESLLAPLGDRWLHVQGVVAVARRIGETFDTVERDYLVAAAYLHDVGYAPPLVLTGFHPLDGARYLRSLGQERLASLVAYHSEAQFEAALRGVAPALAVFTRERSPVADALTYCDQLTGPTGRRILLKDRAADIRARYGDKDIVYQAYRQALPYLSLAIGRTVQRLRRYGVN